VVPFDGRFAQTYVYPFALGAYDAEDAPPGYTNGVDAFEILADVSPAFQAKVAKLDTRHRKPLESMLAHSRRPRITDPSKATSEAVRAMPRNPEPNPHFGWVCVDKRNSRLVVCFRGTEYFQDWLDDFDFSPVPYSPLPGGGRVHQGFQIVYEAVRDEVRKLVQSKAPGCKEILITGHSLGGALSGLCAPDLLCDSAAVLAPIVYTWAEPRVGHPDYVRFFDTRVNICHRIVNLWDLVPHLPPTLALYEHEGASLHIDSGFSLDIVRNHVLITGYAPGLDAWNKQHSLGSSSPLSGKTA